MSEAMIGAQMSIRSITQVALMLGYSRLVSKFSTLSVYQVSCTFDYIKLIIEPFVASTRWRSGQ